MGIGYDTLEFFHRCMSLTLGDIHGRKMCELGDQKLWDTMKLHDDGTRVWAKEYFEERGVHHYSIDIHGMNGTYALDLTMPIRDLFWHNRFDIVTNFGTSEHVDNQYECWRNIHNFGKSGCVYVHILPELGRYRPDHCKYWYDRDFFNRLTKSNKYTMISCEPIFAIGHIGCCYIKSRQSKFVFDDKWVKGNALNVTI